MVRQKLNIHNPIRGYEAEPNLFTVLGSNSNLKVLLSFFEITRRDAKLSFNFELEVQNWTQHLITHFTTPH
jgi:hypothetical protein